MTTRWRWSPRLKTCPAAMPMCMAISAVIGVLLARPRTPSVPKRERDIAPNLSHRLRNREGLAGASDVVDADDGSATPRGLDRQPDRRGIAAARLGNSGETADEAFARRAHQDRIAGIGQPRRAGDQGHVLFDALAETDAGVDGDQVARNASHLAGRGALEKKAPDVLDNVVIGRAFVLVLRPAAPVHQHDRNGPFGEQWQHVRVVAQRRDVVDDARAGIETRPRNGGAAGVDRYQNVVPGQPRHHRQHPAQFLLGRGGDRARPRRLAADIDDVGALRNKTQAIVDGLRWIKMLSAVGKGVGCDVEDRHHPDPVERQAGESSRQTPGCGSGLAPGAWPVSWPLPWPLLVGTEARRRRSWPEPAPPVSSRTIFSPRRIWPISSLLSVSYSSSALAMVCRSSRRSVRIWRAVASASSIRRRTSWSISCAVASETFWVWVTAWPRKTSCSLAW